MIKNIGATAQYFFRFAEFHVKKKMRKKLGSGGSGEKCRAMASVSEAVRGQRESITPGGRRRRRRCARATRYDNTYSTTLWESFSANMNNN